MKLKLLPLPFFIGLGLGLAALSWLGATVQSSDLIQHFVRFHPLINGEGGYFPTARQITAIVDAVEPKVYVIVGGSSTFHGTGQHASLLWTRYLQEHLGPDFRVINFAQRAGSPNDFGNIAAERLLLRSRPVIYVADANPVVFASPLATSESRGAILDAWHRGYLLPWAPRDRLLSEAPWSGGRMRSPALAAALNSFLNFNDLWNFVGYEFGGSIWNAVLRERSLVARRLLADEEAMPDAFNASRYDIDLDKELVNVRNEIGSLNGSTDDAVTRAIELYLPARLRAVTLAPVKLPSPFYVNRLTPTDRSALLARAEHQSELLKTLGLKSVVVGRAFNLDDYIDRVHISVAGGRKLAAELAPMVREMAVELGYLR